MMGKGKNTERRAPHDAFLPVPKRFTNKSLNTKRSSISAVESTFSTAPSRNIFNKRALSSNTFAYRIIAMLRLCLNFIYDIQFYIFFGIVSIIYVVCRMMRNAVM